MGGHYPLDLNKNKINCWIRVEKLLIKIMIADQFAYKICEINLDKLSWFAIDLDDYDDMPALVENSS